MDEIRIIQLSADIPNDGVQFNPALSEEMQTEITNALLEISQTEEGQEALDVAYQWGGLERLGDDYYDQFRQVLDSAGVSAADFQ
jgi:phosphonate transport system substrate-binding protein